MKYLGVRGRVNQLSNDSEKKKCMLKTESAQKDKPMGQSG